MPYTEPQIKLFRAVEHGWNKPGCGCADKAKCSCSPTRKAATKMANEDPGIMRQRKMSNLLG